MNGVDEWIGNPTIGTSFAILRKFPSFPPRSWGRKGGPCVCQFLRKEESMPAVAAVAHQKGDYLVDYEEKVFEDVKAEPGEKALVTFHTVAFEGSIGLVNMLSATRLLRKGFETSI